MDKLYPDTLTMLSKCLVRQEYADTAPLMASLAHVRSRGYFTRDEFLAMCKWKEPRQRKRSYWLKNTPIEVLRISGVALTAPDEARKMLHLCRLKGVGIPVSSAILALIDPDNYGVIDIRVWQVLALYREIDYDVDGTELGLLHWLEYLDMIRAWAVKLAVTARAIERTLWQHHRDIATEPLYRE